MPTWNYQFYSLFSSRSFMIRSVIHLKLILPILCERGWDYLFIVWLCHCSSSTWNKLSVTHWITLTVKMKISWQYICGLYSVPQSCMMIIIPICMLMSMAVYEYILKKSWPKSSNIVIFVEMVSTIRSFGFLYKS